MCDLGIREITLCIIFDLILMTFLDLFLLRVQISLFKTSTYERKTCGLNPGGRMYDRNQTTIISLDWLNRKRI